MNEYDDYDSYESDIEHDLWVEHTYNQYNDFDDEDTEDLDDEDTEDLDDEDTEDLDDEDLDDEYLDDEFAEFIEEKGLVDEFDYRIKNANNLSRDTGLDKFNNTPIPTFPETHRPIKPSFIQRLKKLFRL